MKIHSNDQIIVIAGKDKGKKAKVTKVFPAKNQLLVEGVNIVTKHIKKQGATPGQKVSFEKPIDASNVMLLDPKTGTPTRIGYTIKNGKKQRIAKKSGTVLN
ncbi:50S ribosomal protein L24 [Candidatus Gracilibacteria bacterium]|nr:50S ribosomal protein L24 [Candidatus Gracilibacteria bacterium]